MKNFKSPVRLEVKEGSELGMLIREAVATAIKLNTEVVFEYEGIDFTITLADGKGVYVSSKKT